MTSQKPLRLWPGVIAAVLLCVLRYVTPIVAPDVAFYGFIGAMVCALVIVVWWLLFSRAPWIERIGALGLMVLGVYLASRVVHVSIRTAMMGRMLPVYMVFVLPPALVLWAAATRRLSMFMTIGGLNAGTFYLTSYRHLFGPDAPLDAPMRAKVIAAISLCAWLGVITGGRLLTFYRPAPCDGQQTGLLLTCAP